MTMEAALNHYVSINISSSSKVATIIISRDSESHKLISSKLKKYYVTSLLQAENQ